jgi:hypothetical protein
MAFRMGGSEQWEPYGSWDAGQRRHVHHRMGHGLPELFGMMRPRPTVGNPTDTIWPPSLTVVASAG